jgi:hypothetical protein
MMHVIDAVLDSFSNLFRSHRYSPVEKLYSVVLFTAGLSLWDLSERLCLTGASRESVRTVNLQGIPSTVKFLRKVLDSCEGKPVIVADRGLWYRWALDRLGNNLLPRGEEVIPT